MRKSRKQILSIILAAGMAVTGNASAYAATAGTVVVDDQGTGAAEALGTPTVTTINGTINVTTVNVTVPLTTAFDVDPNSYEASKLNQITTQAAKYKIINNSKSPIYVYVSNVTTDAADASNGKKAVTLVQQDSGLTADQSMMFAIKKAGTKTTSALTTADFWMQTGQTDYKYVLDPDTATGKGKIEAKTTTDDSDEMTLELYCRTQAGWSHGDKFTIKPSFMITVDDPTL